MAKPRIIVLSADTDTVFDWLSDGWHSVKVKSTGRQQRLMARARAQIGMASNILDAIERLKAAGFEVVRGKRADYPTTRN